MTDKKFVLPTAILGPVDVNRTLLELKQLGEHVEQESLRKHTNADASVKLPAMTLSLTELALANKADLLQPDDRRSLMQFLESLQQRAPVLHISFASEASPAFVGQIVDWLRANISHYTLVQVGLQPSIAGGCILRSTNKIFDLSLRKHMHQNRGKMIELMHKARDKQAAEMQQLQESKS